MIPKDFITEWRRIAPWIDDRQVEQDLVISRALVELFSNTTLANSLAFRGGTALYKLHLRPAARYSEDIDLVQVMPGPIGPILDAIRQLLDGWLGEPRWKQTEGRVTLYYYFESEEVSPIRMRLKLEMNTREHFTAFGYGRQPFEVQSRWFTGGVNIRTYQLDELLGTKLRALYQRRKGRDLFDLAFALRQRDVSKERIVESFLQYMKHEGAHVTRALFEQNLSNKRTDKTFNADITPLLAHGQSWNFDKAFEVVWRELIALLPGDAWKGLST
jgi:predicted nucleotidyltransferase component of viral defense system